MAVPGSQIHPNQGELASETSLRQIKHQPGVLVGNDAVPEFHAQTLPPGTAPKDRTFKPNPQDQIPAASDPDAEEDSAQPRDTIDGPTKADVQEGTGKPVKGETGKEERNEQSSSTVGGVVTNKSTNYQVGEEGVDRDHPNEEDKSTLLGAEDKEPVGAEELANEFE